MELDSSCCKFNITPAKFPLGVSGSNSKLGFIITNKQCYNKVLLNTSRQIQILFFLKQKQNLKSNKMLFFYISLVPLYSIMSLYNAINV